MFDKRSNPNYKRDREFYTRFYRKSPLVLEGDGTIESVSLAPIDLLRQLHQRVYSPTNSDLVIAGNLPEDIDQIIEKYFGKLKSGTDLRVKSYPALEPLSERIFYHWKEPLLCSKEHPEESSAEVTVYLVVPPESCPEFSALKILSYSLGGSSNSRLMKALGLEKGLAYRILSQYDGDYNAGVFMIDGYVPAKRLDEAIDAIFKELRTLRKNPISERDLEIFKSTLRLELAEHFESNRGHVLALVDRLETGATPDYYLDEYSKLTIDQIREVAEQYLPDLRDDKNYALLISDPLKQE
jgi:predicted Zn-dependent peptidase